MANCDLFPSNATGMRAMVAIPRLVELAEERRTATYGDLNDWLIGRGYSGIARGLPASLDVVGVAVRKWRSNAPLLHVLVVSASTKIPGLAFFGKYMRQESQRHDFDAHAAAHAEMERVFNYPDWRKFAGWIGN